MAQVSLIARAALQMDQVERLTEHPALRFFASPQADAGDAAGPAPPSPGPAPQAGPSATQLPQRDALCVHLVPPSLLRKPAYQAFMSRLALAQQFVPDKGVRVGNWPQS